MDLKKEVENINNSIENIKNILNKLYYRCEKSDFTTKSYIFDVFNEIKDIEISNYFLKRELNYEKKK